MVRLTIWRCVIGLLAFGATAQLHADTATELEAMVHEFLAGVSEAAVHDRFWAEDLVYTSSRGTRTTKADIMAGFASRDGATDAAGPTYTAADLQVRDLGTTAVVAFRLVATPADPEAGPVLQYLNTGTFALRNGIWQVVAWQATQIPPGE